MFKNYLKITIRNLRKNRLHFLINVAGLAVGLAGSFLILLWVAEELGYDGFHQNKNALQIVLLEEHAGGETRTYTETPGPLAEALKSGYPEIINAARVQYTDDFLVSSGEKHFIEKRILGADPSFLEMFSFPLVQGSRENALSDPNNILITQSMAAKYFGDANPVGQTLHFDPAFDFTVSGVLKDLPANSLFDFEFLVPMTTFMIRYTTILDDWSIPGANPTYVQLRQGQPAGPVSDKIAGLLKEHTDEDLSLKLFPFVKLHTHPEFAPVNSMATGIHTIYTYLAVAILILVIACINFINLTSARFSKRLKEIGIQKTMGAGRLNLTGQFMTESLTVTAIAFLLALGLVELLLPLMNQLAGKGVSHLPVNQFYLWMMYIGLALLTGVVAGVWPVLFFNRAKPVVLLKNQSLPGSKYPRTRQGLVIFQFVLTVVFLVGTWTVYQQLHFMKTFDTGYHSENVISIPLQIHWGHREDGSFYDAFKNELTTYPGIEGVTQSFLTPGDVMTSAGEADWEGKAANQTVFMNWLTVHYDFFDVLGIPIVDGRPFSPEFAGDMSNWDGGSYILNESAVRMMQLEAPVGKWFEHYGKRGEIVGVAKDFHFRNLKQKITPLAMFVHPFYNKVILIKIRPENTQETLAFIRQVWDKHAFHYPFSYSFVDEAKNAIYREERQSALLLNSFAVFAVLIACLGLLGLTAFSVQQRTKEIGIRKTLGASVRSVWYLLMQNILRWIGIAIVIGWPIAWLLTRRWLENYAERAPLTVLPYLLSGAAVLFVAVLIVSWQVVRAAMTNPVESLRYE